MIVSKYEAQEVFEVEGGESLEITYSNRGDPYSQGIDLDFREFGRSHVRIYLKSHEAVRLANFVYELYGDKK